MAYHQQRRVQINLVSEDLMRSQIIGLRVAGTIFGIMSIVQLARLSTGFQIFVAGYEMPLWPNAVAFVIMGGLCIWMWKLSYSSGR